ncbi:MAG: ABC transporter permease [Actinobacteria bacterium]|nr:ABC transporter permease [Actinomycetota bacterium]
MDNDLKTNSLKTGSSFGKNLLRRPEFGSVIGLIVLWAFFSITAGKNGFNSVIIFKSILDLSVSIGIIGVVATPHLIAGEFDLSVGSMVGASGMLLALCIVAWGLPLWLSILITFSFALLYGFIQGYIVVKTKIPSLIVTLGGLFFLRGITFGVAQSITKRALIGGVNEHLQTNWLFKLFAGKIFGGIISASAIWWVAVTILAYFILRRTRFGNWIFATGGSEEAARALGVPTNRVKIILFVATAASVALLSVTQVLSLSSADTLRGALKEMEVIITVVIGGTLITGGYGSPIGTFLGCLTLGLLRQGIYMLNISSEWYQAVLGIVLIIAVLINRTGQRMEKL